MPLPPCLPMVVIGLVLYWPLLSAIANGGGPIHFQKPRSDGDGAAE